MDIESCPNIATYDAIFKIEQKLIKYKKIMLSISGGSDSDLMLDLIQKVLKENRFNYNCEIHYVFFDTGIEYKATKEHLDYLEKKYNITIERVKASCPVPLGCKKYGLPFISKFISQMIERLQQKNFDFKNDGYKSFEELNEKYPKTKGAIAWWCNKNGEKSTFNIERCKYLKEFMIENPPTFKISAKCCNGAKKNSSHNYEKENDFDLKCLGLRKAEGGIRSTRFKSCFDYDCKKQTQDYRPIWWFTDKDKETYKSFYNLLYSDCYEVYGMKRTGCAGCPFNSKFEDDLKLLETKEPRLYRGANIIFGKSYEYTRAYRNFKKNKTMNNLQLSMFD